MKLFIIIFLLLLSILIFCYNNKFSNNDLTFIYFYTDNIYDYAQHSLLNIKKYTQKYNYKLKIFNKVYDHEYKPCWNKIKAILDTMESVNKNSFIVWIDADALINNFNINILDFTKSHDDKDLFICYDCVKDRECLNSGVMIIRNTDWSYNLFNKTWLSKQEHGYNDQNVLLDEIIKERYEEYKDGYYNPNKSRFKNYCVDNIHPKVKIFEENAFNTHIENANYNDFIIHLMGFNTNMRIDIMRQINTKNNLDNYNKNICIELLKNKSDESRTQKLKYNKCTK